MASPEELFIARGTSLSEPMTAQHFKKASAPPTGDKYGAWGPNSIITQRLPGGSALTFDLSRLTLTDFRQMRDDYQLSASLNILTFLCAQADWNIECEDPKIAAAIEEGVRRYWFPLVRAMSTAFWAGFAPTVKVFELNTQSKYYEIVKYKDLLPENSRVNWKITADYRGQMSIYNYDGIQHGIGTMDNIPADQTLWYPFMMESGNMYGRKLLRPAFPAWFFSQLMHLFTNRYFERFGEPTAIGYYPPDETGLDAAGNVITGKAMMENVLTNLRSRGVVTMPSGRDETGNPEWDIKYLESQMRGVDFDRYIARLDEEKSLALFTPVLMFRTGERGSFNLGTMHLQVFQWMLNAILGDWKDYLDKYVIKQLHDINFGPNAPEATIRFRTQGRLTDEGAQSTLLGLIQNGGAKLTPAGLLDLGNYLGLSLEEVQQLTDPGAAPANPLDPNGGQGGPRVKPAFGATGDPRIHPGASESKVAGILGGNPRAPLLKAQKRLVEQVERLYSQKSGGDLEQGLANLKLGFKTAFLNEMSHSGADTPEAEMFFNAIQNDLRESLVGVRDAPSALEAIRDTYTDYGVT